MPGGRRNVPASPRPASAAQAPAQQLAQRWHPSRVGRRGFCRDGGLSQQGRPVGPGEEVRNVSWAAPLAAVRRESLPSRAQARPPVRVSDWWPPGRPRRTLAGNENLCGPLPPLLDPLVGSPLGPACCAGIAALTADGLSSCRFWPGQLAPDWLGTPACRLTHHCPCDSWCRCAPRMRGRRSKTRPPACLAPTASRRYPAPKARQGPPPSWRRQPQSRHPPQQQHLQQCHQWQRRWRPRRRRRHRRRRRLRQQQTRHQPAAALGPLPTPERLWGASSAV